MGILEETITLFEWTKISTTLFECLVLLEVNHKETLITSATSQETTLHKTSGNDDIPHTNQSSVCIPYKYCGFLKQVVSYLALLEEAITLFEWCKISATLFKCLCLLESYRKETQITRETYQETTVHKISGNDDIPHTNQSSVCSPYKSHGFVEQVVSCLGLLKETITFFEWTKISIALFECLYLLEVNCKETPIIGATYLEIIVHKILGNDDIPHTKKS